jgi:hypothetical protein
LTPWEETRSKLEDTLRYVKKHPILDPLARTAIESIPYVGTFLIKVYEKTGGTEEDKSKLILQILKNIQSMTEQKTFLPFKKKRNSGLTPEEKEYNKDHSKRRIVIEQAICRIKKYIIMNDVFRNRLRKYDKASDIVSGLVNYRILNSLG